MELKEKAAYLKGLAEGLNYDKTTAEGKLLTAIIDLLGEMTAEIEGNAEDINYLSEYVDEVDKDLGDVEEYLFGDDEDYDEDDDIDAFEDEDFDENEEDPEN
ncbi:MAG: hypothetical protein MJ137_07600 [Clostridia bacterium]|nr:hypothetical protein [Clostridia bacterium]